MITKKIHLYGETLNKLGVLNKDQFYPNCQAGSVRIDHLTWDIDEVTCLICMKNYAYHHNRPEYLVKANAIVMAERDLILARFK
jgi:hypothetical protein